MIDFRDIPKHLIADSPKGLQRKMMKNNEKYQKLFRYFDIQETNEGKWVCWYYDIMTAEEELQGINKDVNGTESIRQ